MFIWQSWSGGYYPWVVVVDHKTNFHVILIYNWAEIVLRPYFGIVIKTFVLILNTSTQSLSAILIALVAHSWNIEYSVTGERGGFDFVLHSQGHVTLQERLVGQRRIVCQLLWQLGDLELELSGSKKYLKKERFVDVII